MLYDPDEYSKLVPADQLRVGMELNSLEQVTEESHCSVTPYLHYILKIDGNLITLGNDEALMQAQGYNLPYLNEKPKTEIIDLSEYTGIRIRKSFREINEYNEQFVDKAISEAIFTEIDDFRLNHSNHTMFNAFIGDTLGKMATRVEEYGVRLIGYSKTVPFVPEHRKEFTCALVFEDTETFEIEWFHCDWETIEDLQKQAIR